MHPCLSRLIAPIVSNLLDYLFSQSRKTVEPPKDWRHAEHLKSLGLLHDAQYGFTSSMAYLINIISAKNIVVKAMDDGEDTDLYFLAFSKAFNVVNQRIMCKTLTLGVSALNVGWERSFLNNRTFSGSIGYGKSSNANKGPQG